MTTVIHKHVFRESPGDIEEVFIPLTAKPLDFQSQNRKLVMWYEVDTSHAIASPRQFLVIGTGWDHTPIEDHWSYVGTTQVGPFVWHLYEVTERDA